MAVWVKRLDQVQPSESERAFERLFAAEYGKVVAIAYRILADIHEAEDVAQEVFYAYHRRHPADAGYAAAWLHKAAAHSAYNAATSRTRRDRRAMDQIERERMTGNGQNDPQRVLEVAEQQRAVGEALGRLPERQAMILSLRYGGLSYAEVAAALGVGVNQVGTLLHRAEAALRKELTREAS